MGLLEKSSLFLHTVRHLRLSQIAARLGRQLHQPSPRLAPAPDRRRRKRPLVPLCRNEISMLGPRRFVLLNLEGLVDDPADWNDPQRSELWLYHLHYFDDLTGTRADKRRRWHAKLIKRWIRENPPGEGIGWDPYPTSRRIVNWIMWDLSGYGGRLAESAVQSLVVQIRWLVDRLEYHLLGNHLLANAKALIFAGLYFRGREANDWYDRGRAVWNEQMEEQLLEDGAHYELTPMYHAIVQKDLLDLLNIHHVYEEEHPSTWTEWAAAMAEWLRVMRHPDGGIPFFNDASGGMAPEPEVLDRYAGRLGLEVDVDSEDAHLRVMGASGYARVEYEGMVALLDLADVCPDHVPAHAHADTLSFELSLRGRRVFVNCGTSEYGTGPRRRWERSTPAHNTVAVDGSDSSEVWAGFRVARRARITEFDVARYDSCLEVKAAHDGYQRFRKPVIHRRRWRFGVSSVEIEDTLDGQGAHSVSVFLHVHPALAVKQLGEASVCIDEPGFGRLCIVEFGGSGGLTVDRNSYAREFGRLEPLDTLIYEVEAPRMPLTIATHIDWSDRVGASSSCDLS